MHWTEDCICSRWMTKSKTIGFFKISDSRTELRCSRCHGLMGWWDGPRIDKNHGNKEELV